MSNIGNEPPPTKQDVSKWYDEFVRIIFKGLGDKRGESTLFQANTEDRGYCNSWFSDLQIRGKIGCIIFCFNGLDSNPTFDTYNGCQELWKFIGTFPNSRSILTFDSISSQGDGKTLKGCQKGLVVMNDWVCGQSVLSRFESYNEDMINRYMMKPQNYTPEEIREQFENNENINPFWKWTFGLAGTFGIGTTAMYTINRISLYKKNKEEEEKNRRKQYLNNMVESNIRKNQTTS